MLGCCKASKCAGCFWKHLFSLLDGLNLLPQDLSIGTLETCEAYTPDIISTSLHTICSTMLGFAVSNLINIIIINYFLKIFKNISKIFNLLSTSLLQHRGHICSSYSYLQTLLNYSLKSHGKLCILFLSTNENS